MTCQDMIQLLSEYLDGVLEPEWELLLHQHLQTCDACKEELLTLMHLQRAISHNLGCAPPLDCDRLWTGLATQLAGEGITCSRTQRLIRRLGHHRNLLPYSAAAAVMVAVITYWAMPGPPERIEIARDDTSLRAYWREHSFYNQQLVGPIGTPELGILQTSYSED